MFRDILSCDRRGRVYLLLLFSFLYILFLFSLNLRRDLAFYYKDVLYDLHAAGIKFRKHTDLFLRRLCRAVAHSDLAKGHLKAFYALKPVARRIDY